MQSVTERPSGPATAVSIERMFIVIALLVAIAAAGAYALSIFRPQAFARLPFLQRDASRYSAQANSPSDDLDRAEEALFRGDTESAKRLSAAAMANDSSDAGSDYRAGNVALRGGDLAAAQADYTLGESADRRNPWNFIALGQLYARQGKLAEADAQLRAASASGASLQFLHYDLGAVELREGLYAAALADFEAELRRSPMYGPARSGRVMALARLRGLALTGVAGRKVNGAPVSGTIVDAKRSPTRVVANAPLPRSLPAGPELVTVRAYPIPMQSAHVHVARASGVVAVAERAIAADKPPWATTEPMSRPSSTASQGSRADSSPASAASATAQTPDVALAAPPAAEHHVAPGPIPDVIGLTLNDAMSRLHQAGLAVDHVTLLPGSPADARVVNTEPEPGATTPPGTPSVNVVLGKLTKR
ncbi:MAG: PASTA domain-containing protein [Candidatus Eremiobacteraeota bacterium]|nr:PASTA domain-containing protein [Candidatus Eremiobacteraeota bacterium]MBC5826380.1 PASTA domain-containing protein [Candidatus Eremiobacteraeota bacterium]